MVKALETYKFTISDRHFCEFIFSYYWMHFVMCAYLLWYWLGWNNTRPKLIIIMKVKWIFRFEHMNGQWLYVKQWNWWSGKSKQWKQISISISRYYLQGLDLLRYIFSIEYLEDVRMKAENTLVRLSFDYRKIAL